MRNIISWIIDTVKGLLCLAAGFVAGFCCYDGAIALLTNNELHFLAGLFAVFVGISTALGLQKIFEFFSEFKKKDGKK